MKNLCLAFMMLLFDLGAQASTVIFECECDGLQISFVESLKRSGNERVFTFSQDGIEHKKEGPFLEKTVLGQTVSMTYELANADNVRRYATLVIPDMFLTSVVSSVDFNTMFVLTTKASAHKTISQVGGLLEETVHHLVKCSAALSSSPVASQRRWDSKN